MPPGLVYAGTGKGWQIAGAEVVCGRAYREYARRWQACCTDILRTAVSSAELLPAALECTRDKGSKARLRHQLSRAKIRRPEGSTPPSRKVLHEGRLDMRGAPGSGCTIVVCGIYDVHLMLCASRSHALCSSLEVDRSS